MKTVFNMVVRLATFGAALWVFWTAWGYLGPRLPEVGAMRRRLAETVLAPLAEDIRTGRGAVKEAVLLPLAGDPSGYLTERVRSAVETSGVLDLRDRTPAEKLWHGLELRQEGCGALSNALARGAARGARAVLFGSVERFEATAKGAWMDVELVLADTADGRVVWRKRYGAPLAASAAKPGAADEADEADGVGEGDPTRGLVRRWLCWVALVLALPMFTIGFLRVMVRQESNRVNAFTLAAYTLLGAVLVVLVARPPLAGWGWVALPVAALLAGLYTYRVMTYALKLETE